MYNKRFCKDIENVENFEKAKADNFKGWDCHHRKGIDIPREELKALGMYYNRPADELIFLTVSEHRKLHKFSEETKKKLSKANKGKHLSEETRKKVSEAMKGHTVSEETRKKIAEALKGKPRSEETRKKISEAMKGHTVSEETRKKVSEAHKGKSLSEEHKNKVSEATKGRHWYNNGIKNIMSKECPPGFVPGMLRK